MTARLLATRALTEASGPSWTTILRSCGAYEAYLRTYRGMPAIGINHPLLPLLTSMLALIEEETGIKATEIVSNADLCINGTTVGLNALIQHKGARTGLIATAGHEDSIEIRLGFKGSSTELR